MAYEDVKVKEFLSAIRNEAVKMYRTYDGSNRPEFQYEAITHAGDGAPCMVTQYVYDGASSRVIKMKETIGTWVSATMEI